jgi:hypothetical protein
MRIKRTIIFVCLLLIFLLFVPSVQSMNQNTYGKIVTMFRIKDSNGNWGEWQDVSNDIEYKENLIFQIKANVTGKKACDTLRFRIESSCNQEDDILELIDGPSEFDEWINNSNCPVNWTNEYMWTIKLLQNTDCNIYSAGLFINDTGYSTFSSSFDDRLKIVKYEPNATQDNNKKNNDGNGSPGFEIILLLISIISVIFFIKRRKNT